MDRAVENPSPGDGFEGNGPRPPLIPPFPPRHDFDRAYQAWLDAHVAYWGSEECVVLPKVATNAMRTVANWRRGENAVEALPPRGTPVATFLGRKGQPSRYWDGREGLGITGNNTTHAGVLAGYQRTAGGVVTGLKLWELYPGCGGVRRKIYPIDDTLFGTANARSYFVIHDRGGRPLGGVDNPFFRIWQARRK